MSKNVSAVREDAEKVEPAKKDESGIFITVGIPQYMENEQVIHPLLTMIDNQIGFDFSTLEVIIVNDASDVILSEAYLDSFRNFRPKYIRLKENVGPGLARQEILDRMSGKYVLFCDADDILHSIAVLGLFSSLARQNEENDIIECAWLEEVLNGDGKAVYVEHKENATWFHGHLLKKAFIDSIGLRMHPKLRVHEDSFFLGVLYESTTKRTFTDITVYLWRYGRDTITRRNNGSYTYDSFPVFIQSVMYAIEVMTEMKMEEARIRYKVMQLFLYIYMSLQLVMWYADDIRIYRLQTEKMLQLLIVKYSNFFEKYDQSYFNTIYNEERRKILLPSNEIEKETFNAFYLRVLNGNYTGVELPFTY
jgi:glycosyltransferase involved in cell wall biosynthesis